MQTMISVAAVIFAILGAGDAKASGDGVGIAAPNAGYATNWSTGHRSWNNAFFGMPRVPRVPRIPSYGR